LNLDQSTIKRTSNCEKIKNDRQRAIYAERHMMGKVHMIFDAGELKCIESEDT